MVNQGTDEGKKKTQRNLPLKTQGTQLTFDLSFKAISGLFVT